MSRPPSRWRSTVSLAQPDGTILHLTFEPEAEGEPEKTDRAAVIVDLVLEGGDGCLMGGTIHIEQPNVLEILGALALAANGAKHLQDKAHTSGTCESCTP